jgi:hypothetical protein
MQQGAEPGDHFIEKAKDRYSSSLAFLVFILYFNGGSFSSIRSCLRATMLE